MKEETKNNLLIMFVSGLIGAYLGVVLGLLYRILELLQ